MTLRRALVSGAFALTTLWLAVGLLPAAPFAVSAGDGVPSVPAANPAPPARQAGGAWLAATPIPGPISRYGFAQVGEEFYIVSGYTGGGTSNALRRYSAATNTWTNLAPHPAPGGEGTAATYYNGRIYAAAGVANPVGFHIYDIAANTWTPGPTILVGTSGHAMGAYNGYVYMAGGGIGGASPNLQIYDITANSWSYGTQLPSVYQWGGYQQVGQYLYLVGSYTGIPSAVFGPPLFSLDPAAQAPAANSTVSLRLDMTSPPGAWTTGPAWTPARADFGLAAKDGRLYAIGGDAPGGNYLNPTSEVYELDTSAWPGGAWALSPAALPTPRLGNSAGFSSTARAGGEIWSTGGYPHAQVGTSHLYRVTGAVTSTPTPSPSPAARLVGHVTWQGRAALPDPLQQLPLTLTLQMGATRADYANQVTDAGGFFTVPVHTLPSGVYTWWVKGPQYLATSGTVTLTGAPVTQQVMGLQPAGDVNNDNLVDITDFSLLRATFGRVCGDPGYDGRADFTGDCLVDITDFTLQRGNFGQTGPPPP